jgi:hypothetical protein
VRPEAIFARLPYSLSLTLSTPNPQSATSCRPGGLPRPHLPATANPAPHPPSPSHRRRPCARPWRPRLQRQASRCCLAINAHWPPSTPPNHCQPLRPAIGLAAALALTMSCTRRGRRERPSRSRSCTHPLPSRRTPFCMASSMHSCDTHAQHAYASTCPARDRNRASPLHHWTQSTTPSPAGRPSRRIVSSESTLNQDHREHINPRHPSPRPLCLPFAPSPHLLSSVSSPLCIPRSRSP